MPTVRKDGRQGLTKCYMRLAQIGTMKPMSGVPVTVQLPSPCIWRDMHISSSQTFYSDENGYVEMFLPPSEEIRTLTGSRAPQYQLQCQALGRPWLFSVPKRDEWMIVPGS